MSGQLGNCACACPNPEVVEIPGAPGENGAAGTNGTNGTNAFTFLTAQLTIPTVGNTVIASVAVSSWMALGQVVIVSDGTEKGHFEVTALPSSTSATLEFLEYPGDSVATTNIANAAKVSPAGIVPPLAAALPTAFTDNTGGTASDTLAAGVGISTLTIPLTSLATGLSTLAIDLLTGYVPGYAFKLLSFDFVTTIAGTGAGASQTFNLEIGSTDVTGGVLNVTLASTDTIGEVTAGTAITAANTGTAASAISIEMAAGGTVFTAGSGYFVIKIQNMDTANAVASLAEHIDDLITALT
jgi:hypothetical protein